MFSHPAPLPVVLPLIVAAVLAAVGGFLPRRLVDVIGLLTTIAVFCISCWLVHVSSTNTIVYWFGNWHPSPPAPFPQNFPVGICFTIDPIGAGLAALVSLLATASFAFSWAYFEEVKSLYHALMLTFVGAMCGMCLTGDLFNLFVWFELMTAAAVGLCGYKSEESFPLLGALNFAVVNTIGAFLTLGGIALLYAWTGSLNMAEVARSLASHPPATGFLMVAFIFVVAGFLVKMAVVPFQFWLADAHAVAPTPVCVLFSGVMVELGLFALARVYWSTFAPAMGNSGAVAVRELLVTVGALTAITGAIYCFGQRHFKRLLAFSTISHTGMMMIGVAMLDPKALAGIAVYVVGHGLIKGALFLCAGILLHRCGSVDEFDLRGRANNLRPLAVLLLFAALGLAGLPPFATFYGHSELHSAAQKLHFAWLPVVALIAEALTAGAVLRVTARIFLGWGPRREASSRGAPHIPMDTETAAGHEKTPVWMWGPAVVLVLIAAVIAVPTSFRAAVNGYAEHFEQTHVVNAVTLDAAADVIPAPVLEPAHLEVQDFLAILLAFAVAGLALFPQVLGARANRIVGHGIISFMRPLRRLQSGHVGDYVSWFTVGIAAMGIVLLLLQHASAAR